MPARTRRDPAPIETLEALARDVIDLRDRQAAIVLGDALMEDTRYEGRVATGRVRPVRFRTRPIGYASNTRILSDEEIAAVRRVNMETPSFTVPGYETLYNVDRYAAEPTEERWGEIWVQWITPHAHRALLEHRIIPTTFAAPALTFHSVMRLSNEDELIADRLYITRVPQRRKRPVTTALFDILRLDSDNPTTRSIDFDRDPVQLTLLGRER